MRGFGRRGAATTTSVKCWSARYNQRGTRNDGCQPYMLDTNVFNDVLDGKISFASLGVPPCCYQGLSG